MNSFELPKYENVDVLFKSITNDSLATTKETFNDCQLQITNNHLIIFKNNFNKTEFISTSGFVFDLNSIIAFKTYINNDK